MKITQMDVVVNRREPNPNPIRDALQSLPGAGSVRISLATDAVVDGVPISGTGEVGFGRIGGAPDALAGVIEHELKPLVLGSDPAYVRATHAAMVRELEYHGAFGLAMFGIAAVDTALWDCLGRAHGLPCWQLWGGMHKRIPAYAMVGWLNYTEDELRRICTRAKDQGFRGVKIKVGAPTLEEDVARIEIVREVIGDGMDLMVDANQALTTYEAIRRGRVFQELGCLWWEEPLPSDDIEGYAELAQALDIPVATGENLYTPEDFARFIARGAVDIIQPDLRRAGGPTAMLKIGLLADAFRRPYASHGGGPVQLSVMACLPNAIYLETGLLRDDSPFELEDGCAPIPQGPGFSWA
jgi:L-alanine-DL-glutamate epimerase-like enolase superfamily enzyme